MLTPGQRNLSWCQRIDNAAIRHRAPSSDLMLISGLLALLANVTCLELLWRFRKTNVNMSSTFE